MPAINDITHDRFPFIDIDLWSAGPFTSIAQAAAVGTEFAELYLQRIHRAPRLVEIWRAVDEDDDDQSNCFGAFLSRLDDELRTRGGAA